MLLFEDARGKRRGVVVRLNDRQLDRPVVRLLYDDRNRRISPVELNLAKDRDVPYQSLMKVLLAEKVAELRRRRAS